MYKSEITRAPTVVRVAAHRRFRGVARHGRYDDSRCGHYAVRLGLLLADDRHDRESLAGRRPVLDRRDAADDLRLAVRDDHHGPNAPLGLHAVGGANDPDQRAPERVDRESSFP
jgi:hypothetical protein